MSHEQNSLDPRISTIIIEALSTLELSSWALFPWIKSTPICEKGFVIVDK